jgi:hypothetical protein
MYIKVKKLLSIGFVALLTLVISGVTFVSGQSDLPSCTPVAAKTVTIAAAKLFIEYNAAADDLGVHGAFDDHGWSRCASMIRTAD